MSRLIKVSQGMQLRQKLLRPFDRPRNELREEHDIEGIDADVPFRGIASFIDLDHIGKALEGMEGEAKGEGDREDHGA